MNLGIVGSERAKFTQETEDKAKRLIGKLFIHYGPTVVVSGNCHLGGIDRWAIDMAHAWGYDIQEHSPAHLNWTCYKARNMEIARYSDVVICITVKKFPPNYKGMRFPYCYHCKTDEHIKSGGCWTVKYAKSIGKEGRIIVV